MTLPSDYAERVYAGVLGKLVGVYLGRPFEGWSYEQITAELGEITSYVHERLGAPLIVTDDDLSGTFTFLRALDDTGPTYDLSAAAIGQAWLNYIIEAKSTLWWGGMGISTEQTAFTRLTQGTQAPHSGSMKLNSQLVAEQVGAQIFIDGWAMVAPGDPKQAAKFAEQAARVSHDGAAVHAAMLLAAMEAQAFTEANIYKLLEVGLFFIPADSVITKLVHDIVAWRALDKDWRTTRERIAERYGYAKYGGGCHVVPNHALIVLSLLYSEDSLDRALMIANTCGWDTDCNSGNVGCLMGIKNGLAAFERTDWRGPVGDRLFLSSADGGRSITDAVRETYEIVRLGQTLAGQRYEAPKDGARFHFELPGSVQGFKLQTAEGTSMGRLLNVLGHSARGMRSLAVELTGIELRKCLRVATATFIPPDALTMSEVGFVASPTLYSGQTLSGRLEADGANSGPVHLKPFIAYYDGDDQVRRLYGEALRLEPATAQPFSWTVGDTFGGAILEVGLELHDIDISAGTFYLDYLHWEGAPTLALKRPAGSGQVWKRAWVPSVDQIEPFDEQDFYISQARGTGLLIQGTREWSDYRASTTLVPKVATSFGLAARVQGLNRYYALLLCAEQKARLVKMSHQLHVLAERDFAWQFGQPYTFDLQISGSSLQAVVNDTLTLEGTDSDATFSSGGVALVCEEGMLVCHDVKIAT